MKNLLFAFAIVAAFGLTSCEKEYTCTCTIEDSSGVIDTVTSSTTVTGKKNDVRDACEAGSSTVGTITTTCTID